MSVLQWWQMMVYAVSFIIITPVYILVFICILKLRSKIVLFKSSFYTILIQHNIADILSLILYSLCRAAFVWTPNIIYNHPELEIAAIYYNGLYWAIIARSNGIVLMTVQRFLILVKPNYKITFFIQHAKPYIIWSIYWIPSFLFCVFFFTYTGVIFDSPDNMALLMDSAKISRATMTSFLYLLVSCVICISTYGIMIGSIRKRSHSATSSFQREIRLAFQVALFVAALVILLIYLFLLNFFAQLDDKASIVNTRKYYPLVCGTLSFIGPFTILIFNKDVSRRFRLMFIMKPKVGQSETSIGSSVKQNTILTATKL